MTRRDGRRQACFQLLAGADIVGNQQIDPWQSGPHVGLAKPIISGHRRLILGTTIMVVFSGPSSRSNHWPREWQLRGVAHSSATAAATRTGSKMTRQHARGFVIT